ncbi:MAG TPA: thioredoxin domain-containing protein [Rhizomicrobium sp.]|nr:thioredoxin domain-containing protein [Rhizomicrobium sp.]
MLKKRLVMLGVAGLLLLAAGMAGGAFAATLPPDKVTADDKAMGSAKAPVTMIEYYAQACSVCARFNQDVFPQLKAKYIDTGQVRYVMRLFPLFPEDGPSYKLTRCVPPQNYFKAVDLLFRNQPQWDSAEFPGADARGGLLKMARLLGLKDAQALACMNSTEHDAAINKIAQDGDAHYAIGGTPTLVINFKKVEMRENSWAEAQAAIDAALAAKGIK